MTTADQQRRYRARKGARTGVKGRPVTAECGTRGGFKRHKREREAPCGPCTEADALYQAGRNIARKLPPDDRADFDALDAGTQRLYLRVRVEDRELSHADALRGATALRGPVADEPEPYRLVKDGDRYLIVVGDDTTVTEVYKSRLRSDRYLYEGGQGYMRGRTRWMAGNINDDDFATRGEAVAEVMSRRSRG